jgi:hypothetical protein
VVSSQSFLFSLSTRGRATREGASNGQGAVLVASRCVDYECWYRFQTLYRDLLASDGVRSDRLWPFVIILAPLYL